MSSKVLGKNNFARGKKTVMNHTSKALYYTHDGSDSSRVFVTKREGFLGHGNPRGHQTRLEAVGFFFYVDRFGFVVGVGVRINLT